MKIAFTGPESSGKTSVSLVVSECFKAQWFPEYARTYLEKRAGEYGFSDIEQIAREQEEEREMSSEKGLKIYDTEATVLYIWSLFKYQKCSDYVRALYVHQKFDHYFLNSPDNIPWEEDPLRETPFQREELFELYLLELQKKQVDFTILEGSFEERIAKAKAVIEQLLKDTKGK